MPKANFSSVDEYVASKPETVQNSLLLVRKSIRKALPGADEVISYNMPTYKELGTTIVHFAAWKEHYALYLSGSSIVAAFEKQSTPVRG